MTNEKHKAKFIKHIQISENIRCLIFRLKLYDVILELH